jgi:hypothetical protein
MIVLAADGEPVVALGAGGRGGRCPGRRAARGLGEVKHAARLLGHLGVAIRRVDGYHGKRSKARGRAEAG